MRRPACMLSPGVGQHLQQKDGMVGYQTKTSAIANLMEPAAQRLSLQKGHKVCRRFLTLVSGALSVETPNHFLATVQQQCKLRHHLRRCDNEIADTLMSSFRISSRKSAIKNMNELQNFMQCVLNLSSKYVNRKCAYVGGASFKARIFLSQLNEGTLLHSR